MTVRIIPGFERQTALEGLGVGDPSLGVDAAPPRFGLRSSDLGVPGTEVTIHRERYLGSPAEARVQAGAEALEKCQLAAISDRVARWKGADAEVEADHGEPGSELLDRDTAKLASLESQHLLVRGASCGGHVPKTQTCCHSGQAMLLPCAPHRFAGTSTPAVGWSFSRSHVEHAGPGPFTGAYGSPGRVWSGHGTNGRARTRQRPKSSPTGVIWSGHGTKRRRKVSNGARGGAPAVPWSVSGTKRAPRSAARAAACHP